MAKRDIIVIGASAGGVYALKELVANLPADFPAAIFVALHISANEPSLLPQVLTISGRLAAAHPSDGEPIKQGQIYIAPPDHHLLVEPGRVLVKKGPKENRFRPSIDALFRSAAYTYGPRVIGVVLTGMLDDGTSGMWSIQRLGGVCVIQPPPAIALSEHAGKCAPARGRRLLCLYFPIGSLAGGVGPAGSGRTAHATRTGAGPNDQRSKSH